MLIFALFTTIAAYRLVVMFHYAICVLHYYRMMPFGVVMSMFMSSFFSIFYNIYQTKALN